MKTKRPISWPETLFLQPLQNARTAEKHRGISVIRYRRPQPLPLLLPDHPGRVGVAVRVVEHVGVRVPVLRVVRCLDHRVGLQKPPQRRVVDPAVHVDHVQSVQHLVAREPARGAGETRCGDAGRAAVGSALAERIEAAAFDHCARFIGRGNDAADVVGEQVFFPAMPLTTCCTSAPPIYRL